MYARMIAFSGADSSKREAALEMIRGTVIPMLRSYDGYEGYISLYDEENSRAKAIILWGSREAAESAEETLVESEPEKFSLPSESDMRYHWAHVRLAAIDADEMRELVEDAWAFCVPKSVAEDYASDSGYR